MTCTEAGREREGNISAGKARLHRGHVLQRAKAWVWLHVGSPLLEILCPQPCWFPWPCREVTLPGPGWSWDGAGLLRHSSAGGGELGEWLCPGTDFVPAGRPARLVFVQHRTLPCFCRGVLEKERLHPAGSFPEGPSWHPAALGMAQHGGGGEGGSVAPAPLSLWPWAKRTGSSQAAACTKLRVVSQEKWSLYVPSPAPSPEGLGGCPQGQL